MAHRFSRLVTSPPLLSSRLAGVCFVLALLIPIGLVLGHLFAPQAQLAWAVTSDYQVPRDAELFESRRWTHGGVMVLTNLGRRPTGDVRVLFEWAPEHVDVLNRSTRTDLTPTEDSTVTVIGSLEPGHEVFIHVFGYSPYASGVTVLENGQPVEGRRIYPPRIEAPTPWLPAWLCWSGALLLSGLGLEILSLRRASLRKGRGTLLLG